MSTPIFVYEVRGEKKHADPQRVRRLLLSATEGRCWALIQEARAYIEKVKELQPVEKELREDLEKNPPTLVEESNESAKDIADVNLLPRPHKLKAVIAQIALLIAHVSKIEATLSAASMDAFEFAPLDPETGDGITEDEAFQVLIAFLEFGEGKE